MRFGDLPPGTKFVERNWPAGDAPPVCMKLKSPCILAGDAGTLQEHPFTAVDLSGKSEGRLFPFPDNYEVLPVQF